MESSEGFDKGDVDFGMSGRGKCVRAGLTPPEIMYEPDSEEA